MLLNTRITWLIGATTGAEGDLAWPSAIPCFADEALEQGRVEEEVVPVYEQLLIVVLHERRKFGDTLDLSAPLTERSEQITLEQPERFVQEP